MVLYRAREEIYLQLTADGWRDWADALQAELPAAAPPPAAAAAVIT
jgi:hypothetical protein